MDCCMQDLSGSGSKQGSSLAAQADLDVADSQGTDKEVSEIHADECMLCTIPVRLRPSASAADFSLYSSKKLLLCLVHFSYAAVH